MEKDSPRKRPRENETPSQRLKREKAAERQRRKRERDRAASGLAPPQPMPAIYNNAQVHDATTCPPPHETDLSPEEQARRERVRAAARERQRKHRQMVKQKKMRELGLDMGNDIMGPGMDEVHYRVGPDGQYQQVPMPHDLAAAQQAHQHLLAAQQQQQGQQPPPGGEPPFPQGPPHGGQTFATTLLLSFSCAPLLKQHLLRTLNMTNDELASLEPVIAEAWDRWDQARRMRYDHPDAFPPGSLPPPPGQPYPPPPPGVVPVPYPPGAPGAPPPGSNDDFRGRFQRVMAVPAPFHHAHPQDPNAFPPPDGQNSQFSAEFGAQNGAPANGQGAGAQGGSSHGGEAIDPHLGGGREGGRVSGGACRARVRWCVRAVVRLCVCCAASGHLGPSVLSSSPSFHPPERRTSTPDALYTPAYPPTPTRASSPQPHLPGHIFPPRPVSSLDRTLRLRTWYLAFS
ncbi:hypothetical protein MSAN_01151200 [Mycena sanguinolenta]|uniref:Uncharacterized protein n=1 Tax=Mycena sanguinolenta TaxID=230812 RepID=A0A8H6YM63_9AGAR|nr:hypothetical protein MSAN_01151200 [Mycena sanguinolenta]